MEEGKGVQADRRDGGGMAVRHKLEGRAHPKAVRSNTSSGRFRDRVDDQWE